MAIEKMNLSFPFGMFTSFVMGVEDVLMDTDSLVSAFASVGK